MDRRTFLHAGALSLAAARPGIRGLAQPPMLAARASSPDGPLALPSRSQLTWQRDELAMFLHFGVNTFTDREWGDGKEDPAIFNPARLDARQWARTAKAAGFRALILTAKHHDGFCLWPTTTTRHSVAASPFRGGQGDVVREFVDACAAEGLRAGLYLSPWDRNHPTYGDSPAYNDVYATQLTELLTRYGTISEVWFDGANGEGPNGRRQVYDWPRVWGLVRRLQPDAVIFSDAGPDVRWCGNERGVAGEPNWSPVDPAIVRFPGQSDDAVGPALQHGNPTGSVWRPAEVDVSIRPGWFYHPAQDGAVRTEDNLVQLYFTSVGRNAKLLLNVPPTRDGLLHDTDAARLVGLHRRLETMRASIIPLTRLSWRRTGDRTAVGEWSLGSAAAPRVVRLGEDIARGQRVARYTLEGKTAQGWQPIGSGTTIGHCWLERIESVAPIRQVRLRIEDALAPPEPVSIELFRMG
ncbi:MAG: alpha-L-fucosidase [Gemmatimonadetes bacterium]|nr:alpha-L-fucosidase [Gemmatimonadota bacterium]